MERKTIEQLKALTPAELDEVAAQHGLGSRAGQFAASLAQSKRQADIYDELRGIKKGHWTITPTFIVVLVTMLFAGIAAFPVIQSWILHDQDDQSSPAEKGPPVHLEEAKEPTSVPPAEAAPVDDPEPPKTTEQGDDAKPDPAQS